MHFLGHILHNKECQSHVWLPNDCVYNISKCCFCGGTVPYCIVPDLNKPADMRYFKLLIDQA